MARLQIEAQHIEQRRVEPHGTVLGQPEIDRHLIGARKLQTEAIPAQQIGVAMDLRGGVLSVKL